MSVAEVVERLRAAYILAGEARAACAVADRAIDDATEIFDAATRTSIWPQVPKIRGHGDAAAEDVRLAAAALTEAQRIMEGYCWNIAGHGLGAVAPLEAELRASSTDSSPTESPQTDAAGIEPTAQYAEWAAELEQTGADIDRTKVVRMIRLRDGRIAWLERGHPRKGLDHILEKQKRDAFEGTGVPREKIVELVFAAIEHGVVVGYSGRNRPVYEVVFDGETRRVAITIADDGGIIGAHPIPAKRKIRPNPHRR